MASQEVFVQTTMIRFIKHIDKLVHCLYIDKDEDFEDWEV